MPHFLISSENIKNDFILIDNQNTVAHLSGSLRIKQGENIKLVDNEGMVYFCEVVEILKNEIKAKVLKREKSNRFLSFKINLIQSVLKPDAQNLAIENAIQMGVDEIHPVISDNSTVKFSFAKTKTEKWQKIADEAFKQCERATVAKVFEVKPLLEVLKNKKNIIVFAEKNANTSLINALKKNNKNDEINVLIGPEGGFSELEFKLFENNNFSLVSLGNLILKAPNAITASLANIIYEKEYRD